VMARRAARVDTSSKALRAYAESLGFLVIVLNGVIDCLLVWGSRVLMVDWKSKGGLLTSDQAKLVARGAPIKFISTPEQLDALKREVSQ
jgi:ATP-dependent exoDNAse (exonuclease V) beta subunit